MANLSRGAPDVDASAKAQDMFFTQDRRAKGQDIHGRRLNYGGDIHPGNPTLDGFNFYPTSSSIPDNEKGMMVKISQRLEDPTSEGPSDGLAQTSPEGMVV